MTVTRNKKKKHIHKWIFSSRRTIRIGTITIKRNESKREPV